MPNNEPSTPHSYEEPDLQEALVRFFGHRAFRPGQEEIISRILSGKNCLGVFPTGGGKSLCYQLPSFHLDGLTLVISPLLALMQDQCESLKTKNIAAAHLSSALTHEERAIVKAQVNSRTLKILFLSPETLVKQDCQELLKKQTISLVAIDEAHCVSEWGNSFRPDYTRIPQGLRTLKPRSILALTATASRATVRDLCKAFKIRTEDRIILSAARSNLQWTVSYPTSNEEKNNQLLALLQPSQTPSVIYCTRQRTTESVAHFLRKHGQSARAFHAGLTQETKTALLTDFLENRVSIIVATIAFGMGIDKSNIRSVIHYDLPRSPESWIQEAGRAGRDNKAAQTHVFAQHSAMIDQGNLILSGEPSAKACESIIRSIFSGNDRIYLSPYDLTTTFDVSRDVYARIVTRLETLKLIRYEASLYRKAKADALRPLSQSLQALCTRRWVDLLDICDHSIKKLIRLNEALEDAHQAEDIRLEWSHRLHVYKVKPPKVSLNEIVKDTVQHFTESTERELARLHKVEAILTSRSCIQKSLLKALGEKNLTNCGRCSSCLGHARKRKLPRTQTQPFSDDRIEKIRTLLKTPHPQLTTARQLSRFLLGIASPAARRHRLQRFDEFGILEGHEWNDVHALCRSFVSD